MVLFFSQYLSSGNQSVRSIFKKYFSTCLVLKKVFKWQREMNINKHCNINLHTPREGCHAVYLAVSLVSGMASLLSVPWGIQWV